MKSVVDRASGVPAIPTGWTSRSLSDLTDANRPIGYGIVQTGPLVQNGIRCVRVVDMRDGCIECDDLITTSEEISSTYKRTLLCEGDVVIALRGKIGEVALVKKDLAGANLTRGVALLAKSKKVNGAYLAHFLSSPVGKAVLEKSVNGSALQELPIAALRKLPVAVPSLEEQAAIAEALSEIGKLLAKLEVLITKKRDLKQAAMQQLLTGKRRLPAFSGEWQTRRLGELLSYEQPTKYLVSRDEYNAANDVPVLTAGKTFVLGYTNESHGVVRDLPVIIFDDFTTASKYVTFPFKAKSSAMKLLRLRDSSSNLKLIYEMIQLIDFELGDHKRYWISEFQHLTLKVPESKEQAAIAGVLEDMDREIETLTRQRGRLAALKQGMMQELLTGRIRLT